MVDQPRYRSRFNDPGDDDWADGRSERRSYRRPEPRFEQRLDQWMTAGRQLVDGVAGARPGSRPSARGTGSAAGPRLRPGDLGRWVENKIDWLLEDDDGWREPWQEPRSSAMPSAAPVRNPSAAPGRSMSAAKSSRTAPPTSQTGAVSSAAGSRRRPLEAISLRGTPLLPERPSSLDQSAADPDWPDDESFSVSRWRRGDGPGQPARERDSGGGSAPASSPLNPRPQDPPEPQRQSAAPPSRAMPRSSRRRLGD